MHTSDYDRLWTNSKHYIHNNYRFIAYIIKGKFLRLSLVFVNFTNKHWSSSYTYMIPSLSTFIVGGGEGGNQVGDLQQWICPWSAFKPLHFVDDE